MVADHLGELADHLVGHFVDRARAEGATWAAIGHSLGVSKQAVQKRFVAGEPAMHRFTNRATVVVLKAQNAARDRGHPEVSSLHLLLGLLAEWEGHAPYAAGLRTVLSLATRESLRLGHGYVGTEHLLLALLQAGTEPGHHVLAGLGVSRPEIEAWTRQALAEHGV